ncbi:hypothetical protein BpHYR1_021046 [Brachionus plicatilis]|uniref:Uncharacterized protein n=1 Tax=Brachionus plicatilis TaxID=10195 RepID=A0A3M7P3N1_BRAPC|nr:hypothetical protein BpHYR1_021046 [Brachionus plicatilis]
MFLLHLKSLLMSART